MVFFVLSLLVQVALIVHVFRTGRSTTWVFVIAMLPLVGSIAYFLVELLPDLRGARVARRVERKVGAALNPERDLKAAARNLAAADTVQNAMRLAEECLEQQRFAEARDLYQRALRGLHEEDPHLRLGLARAEFGLGEHAATLATLERLRTHNPDFQSADGHLLYARSKEVLGDIDAALHEYEALAECYPGPEPKARLAGLLASRGDNARAQRLYQRILDEAGVAGRNYIDRHRSWVDLARREIERR
jgi:hypothetical protein